jgi:hypothetical protein
MDFGEGALSLGQHRETTWTKETYNDQIRKHLIRPSFKLSCCRRAGHLGLDRHRPQSF